jgi:hypothetical protein
MSPNAELCWYFQDQPIELPQFFHGRATNFHASQTVRNNSKAGPQVELVSLCMINYQNYTPSAVVLSEQLIN